MPWHISAIICHFEGAVATEKSFCRIRKTKGLLLRIGLRLRNKKKRSLTQEKLVEQIFFVVRDDRTDEFRMKKYLCNHTFKGIFYE
jgi:hypothetical protein